MTPLWLIPCALIAFYLGVTLGPIFDGGGSCLPDGED